MTSPLLDARAQVAALTAERDAYKRAKAENDERFMLERDEARRERDTALARIAALEAQVTRLHTEPTRLHTAPDHVIGAGFVAVNEALAERDAAFTQGVRRGLEVAAEEMSCAVEADGTEDSHDRYERQQQAERVAAILAINPSTVKP